MIEFGVEDILNNFFPGIWNSRVMIRTLEIRISKFQQKQLWRLDFALSKPKPAPNGVYRSIRYVMCRARITGIETTLLKMEMLMIQ